jgi:hypothetical protein
MAQQQSRNPHILAYNAVRDADSTEVAKRVYDAMEASDCYRPGKCVVSETCPFYVDCSMAEGDGDG